MATLLLQTAGAVVGGLFGPVGAVIGRAVGGLAGAAIDRSLFGGSAGPGGSGPKLRNLEVTASTEGTAISRVWGRGRVAGQIIWATRLQAVTRRETSGGGGKGGSGGGGGTTTETTRYFANVALGLCEGRIARVARVWADGNPLDMKSITMRVHYGSEDQAADPLIVAKEGAANAPAYRGLAYVVFERLALEAFGNRVPQLSFEVVRPIGTLEEKIEAITLIPGSTEFGYDTMAVTRTLGLGESAPENRHTGTGATDFVASLDELEALCPNLKHVSLVVSWFGDDLRAGHCRIAPRVDSRIKRTAGAEWAVCGLDRGSARLVSHHEGVPAYGGTPNDRSVIRAIANLKARGIGVTLYPFLMMDVPAGNSLPSPTTGIAPQQTYPWRGRITTTSEAAAAAQVASFFGAAVPNHFRVTNGNPIYTGSTGEWSWRRFVLHMANIARAAGGVDAIIIGSEFRDLTKARSAPGVYPAVGRLAALAADVRAMLGPGTRITYAADWTEYGAHVLDGGAEVRFPLDPLWASPAIDAIGMDWYAPLADWRDGEDHLDRSVAATIHDRAYLTGNIAGGEGYDWFYASAADRTAQRRTPITDGLGKPWIHRQKDIASWWREPHFERVGGVELATPTAWVPGSKPIWLTEIGCPAVDKGANAPNVFPDPKSADGGLPYFSKGTRDDLIQRRAIEALLDYWSDGSNNPQADSFQGRMVDVGRIAPWTWDARPYPAFPFAGEVWADARAHETGHWLTGRLGQAPLGELVSALIAETGVPYDVSALEDVMDGFALDRPASAREALDVLAETFAFTAAERDGALACLPRGRSVPIVIAADELAVERGEISEPALSRGQESELPAEIALGFFDPGRDFQPGVVSARRRVVTGGGTSAIETPIATDKGAMQQRADIRLQDLWVGRETASFAMAPSRLEIEPGDVVALEIAGEARTFEVTAIGDGAVRRVETRAIAREVFDAPRTAAGERTAGLPTIAGPPEVVVLDFGRPEDPAVLAHVAVAARPWPGAVTLWREAGGTYRAETRVEAPAIIGETLDAMAAGPAWRLDRGTEVTVRISAGELIAATDAQLLSGANLAAIESEDGAWEILQFGEAQLVGTRTYRLGRLLRGQGGTEHVAERAKAAGRRFVLLDNAVVPLLRGVEFLNRPVGWRATPAGADHADEMAQAFTSRAGATALRPWAPVHLGARRTRAGIAISWVRRTRIEGDGWEVQDVPLGEDREAYRVEILDGEAVRRTADTAAPAFLYTNAQEHADFGARQARITVRVVQVSALVGAGAMVQRRFDV